MNIFLFQYRMVDCLLFYFIGLVNKNNKIENKKNEIQDKKIQECLISFDEIKKTKEKYI